MALGKSLIEFESLHSSDSGKKEKKQGRVLQENEANTVFSLTAELTGTDSAGGFPTTPGSLYTMAGVTLLAGVAFA